MAKHNSLDEEIKKAKRAEGFLIMLSRLQDGKLYHSWHTNRFPRTDFLPSLEHHRQSLKKEMPPATMGETEINVGEKQLPPEYRDKKREAS